MFPETNEKTTELELLVLDKAGDFNLQVVVEALRDEYASTGTQTKGPIWPASSLWCSREAPGFSGPWTPFLRVASKGKDCSSTSFVGKDECCCSCLAGQMGKATYIAS